MILLVSVFVFRKHNKKLSYRRETARQLRTWSGGGLGPPAHSPTPSLATPMRMVESKTRNQRMSSVPSTKHILRWIGHSRSFKVILIGAGRNPEWCVVIMCINTHVISETYEDMATGKRQIRRFQRSHSSLKTSQQEMPSNIYKRFILPETSVIGLHFCRWQYGSTFFSFHVIMLQSRTLWI